MAGLIAFTYVGLWILMAVAMALHSAVVLLAYLSCRSAWRNAIRRRGWPAIGFSALAIILAAIDRAIWFLACIEVRFFNG